MAKRKTPAAPTVPAIELLPARLPSVDISDAVRASATAALADTQTSHGSSRWGEYRRCQLAHHLRYHLRLVPRDRPAHFGIGALVHAVLRYMQTGVVLREPTARRWEDVLDVANDDPTGTWPPEILDEAHRLMSAYYSHYGLDNAGWPDEAKIIGVEQELDDRRVIGDPAAHDALALTPFVTPYTSRADTILSIAGEIVIVDTKTRKARLPDAYADRAGRGNSQFLGLSWLVKRRYGLQDPPSVMVNAIVKTKVPGFQRPLVRFTQADLDWWEASQVRWAETALAGSTPCPEACAPVFGSLCWAFDYCHGSEESKGLHYTIGDITDEQHEDD